MMMLTINGLYCAEKVNDIQTQLPEGASIPIVKDDFGDVMGMFYAMTSDGLQ